jgi:hypothetical protein
MSISTAPPPAPPKKRGLGCFGCGCLILALLVILFLSLVGGSCYFGYQKVVGITSTTPSAIPSFDGGDDVYNAAQQKVSAFGHDVVNHQATTIELSADEINTLIARNPDLIQPPPHLFVTLVDDRAQVQGSIPTDALTQGFLKGRYVNFDAAFGLSFNSDTKGLDLTLHHLQIDNQTMPQNLLPTLQAEFTPLLNMELQQYPPAKNLLQQAKAITIQNGQLVIETQ